MDSSKTSVRRSTGFNVEIGWRWISVHYTDIEYTNDFLDFFDEEIDASHVGLRFTYGLARAGRTDRGIASSPGGRPIRGTPFDRDLDAPRRIRRPASGTTCPPPGAPSRTWAGGPW